MPAKKPPNAMQNPLHIDWPHHLRAGLAPPHYYTRERKLQFMAQLYQNRIEHLNTLNNLNVDQKLEETTRQRTNLNSKQLKLNRRPKLTQREERRRKKAQAAAEAEELLPAKPPTPPGTSPPSSVAQPYTPIEHPPLTDAERDAGYANLITRTDRQTELKLDAAFNPRKAEGKVPGISNTDAGWSDLTVYNNSEDTFSIWSAVATSLSSTQNYAAWPTVKANIIKYFFRVLGDENHQRHRVYHVLQKRSELNPDFPDLTTFLINNDPTIKGWDSMDPGLWTVIADFYGVEVVIIRSRDQACPEGTIFPEIYNEGDPDVACDYFVIVRGQPNFRNQIILYFTSNLDGTEQAWPVRFPNHYSAHMRDPTGDGLDLSNRVDDMPWNSRKHDDPARRTLQHLTRLSAAQNDPLNVATADEVLQLAALGKDLSYMQQQAIEKWEAFSRSVAHIDTWSHE